ncbi:MAG TPA: hypothetical protein DCS97_16455, partial [Planctomycetes bacterium]|nr:hypothetical protein [Planctomycetota bacterium]
MSSEHPDCPPDLAVRIRGLGKTYRIHEAWLPGISLKDDLLRLATLRWLWRRDARREFHALDGIDLDVRPGEVVGILGGNGAGKTTTLLCASAVHHAAAGSVLFHGEDITRLPAHAVVARGLVQVPEGRRIFPRLSVAENLAMGAWLRRDRVGIARDRERVYALFPVLAERRGQEGGTLSGGEQQMLALGRALMAAPR